jgi:hypothetical protein
MIFCRRLGLYYPLNAIVAHVQMAPFGKVPLLYSARFMMLCTEYDSTSEEKFVTSPQRATSTDKTS